MKKNKLFSSLSHLDEDLLNEAVSASQKKAFPVGKIAAAAAALIFIALSAAVLVNIHQPKNITAENSGSKAQISEKADAKPSDTPQSSASAEKPENSEPSITPSTAENSSKPLDFSSSAAIDPETDLSAPIQEVPNTDTEPSVSQSSSAVSGVDDTEEHSEVIPVKPPVGEEDSDMAGFLIKDGQTYMQVFNQTEYTLDQDIGRVGDFAGYYSGREDNSRVYTVKEDDKILVVQFEAGGSVTLMLWEEYAVDRMGYYFYHGLRVDRSLMAALSSGDSKTYSVYATRPDSDDMYDYEYNGKTIREIKAALEESWKTEHGKYNPLEEEYQAALHAFLKEKIRYIYELLISKGIKAELINEVRCEIEVTKKQFDAFADSTAYLDEFAFGLSSGGYFIDEEPEPEPVAE